MRTSPPRERGRVGSSFFFSFFAVLKGKGDEGSFIFVGRGCLFFFCETFWHDFGMDGLEFLILINAVRFFKKGTCYSIFLFIYVLRARVGFHLFSFNFNNNCFATARRRTCLKYSELAIRSKVHDPVNPVRSNLER